MRHDEARAHLRSQGFNDAEVERILAEAATRQAQADTAAEQLTEADLIASAEAVGIEARHVRAEIEELREEQAEQRQRAATLRRLIPIAIGAVLVLVFLMALATRASVGAAERRVAAVQAELAAADRAVAQAEAQVQNVIERRDRLAATLPATAGQTVTDELTGAENRIAVERERRQQAIAAREAVAERYQAAVADYNRRAGTFRGRLFGGGPRHLERAPSD